MDKVAEVFVSYAREDRSWVETLIQTLGRKTEWDIWWDDRLLPGNLYNPKIHQALTGAKAVVTIWSTHSIGSEWVCDEANEGKKVGKLVPIIIEAIEPPLGFRGYQAVDLTGWAGDPDDVRIAKLIAAVDVLVARRPTGEWKPIVPPPPLTRHVRRSVLTSLAIACLVGVGVALYLAAAYFNSPEFTSYEGISILDSGGQILSDLSFEQCQERCATADENSCKAYSYLVSNRACFMKISYREIVRDGRVRSGIRTKLPQPKMP